MQRRSIDFAIEEVFGLYEKHGAVEYAGEKVSQLEHMCQAAQFAMAEGYDDEVVLAAFLHDIGHLIPIQQESESMNGYGMVDHEKVGTIYLRELGFSERVCKLIASHVNAKRYLTYKYPEYYDQLSEASKETLKYQGGKMEVEEANEFESDPLFECYIKLRKWDDTAKVEQQPMPGISIFKNKAKAHLEETLGKR